MKLSKAQIERLKDLDIVKETQGARYESNEALNTQGFAVLSLAVSHLIADIVEHPERLVKEFAR